MPTRQRITFANRTGEQLAAALPLDAALERKHPAEARNLDRGELTS